MEKFYKVSEAAQKLEVSPETLRRWDNNGRFVSQRHPINNYRVYTEEQLETFEEEFQLEIGYQRAKEPTKNIQSYFETSFGKLYQTDAIDFLKK